MFCAVAILHRIMIGCAAMPFPNAPSNVSALAQVCAKVKRFELQKKKKRLSLLNTVYYKEVFSIASL